MNTHPTPPQQNKQSRTAMILGCVLLMALTFLIGLGIGSRAEGTALQSRTTAAFPGALRNTSNSQSTDVDFSLFWKAWDLLGEDFVDRENLDDQELVYGAIRGMMRATGDPYTAFLTPEQNQVLQEELDGEFEGIGAEIDVLDNVLTIISPLDDSPAKAAGLRPADKVLAIDGEDTADIIVQEAVKKIRGPRGTDVVLTIFREGEVGTQDITITRATIHITSVRVDFVEPSIAHVRLSQFGTDTTKEYRRVLTEILGNNTKGMILDLRNNPGGFLDTAVAIASTMIPRNSVVLLREDADGNRTQVFSKNTNILEEMPTVVLINQGSASASEILAGALRDNRDDVTILGETSFGKGSVQEVVPLPEDTAAKITVERWLTPKGSQINEQGISPDITVEFTQEDADADRDPQLERAIEILSGNRTQSDSVVQNASN